MIIEFRFFGEGEREDFADGVVDSRRLRRLAKDVEVDKETWAEDKDRGIGVPAERTGGGVTSEGAEVILTPSGAESTGPASSSPPGGVCEIVILGLLCSSATRSWAESFCVLGSL